MIFWEIIPVLYSRNKTQKNIRLKKDFWGLNSGLICVKMDPKILIQLFKFKWRKLEQKSVKFTFDSPADPESNIFTFEKNNKKTGYFNRITPVNTRVLLATLYGIIIFNYVQPLGLFLTTHQFRPLLWIFDLGTILLATWKLF